MLRVKPDNSCIIQKLDCATGNWVDWFDASCAVDPSSQTARDSFGELLGGSHGTPSDTDPEANTCVEYDLYMAGNNQTLFPVKIDQGDKITITNAKGLISQTGPLPFIGTAFYTEPSGSGTADSSFPAPSLPQMRLIMYVGGQWVDAFNVTDYEVPAGVVQDHLPFMINDADISDNLGGCTFHVKVCKGDLAFWNKVWDFAGGDQQGWTAYSGLATWNGHGWDAVEFGGYTACIISAPGTADPITGTKMDILGYISGTSTDGNTSAVFDINGGTHNSTQGLAGMGGGTVEDSFVGDITSVQHAIVRMNGSGTGHIDIVRVHGTGTIPPEWA